MASQQEIVFWGHYMGDLNRLSALRKSANMSQSHTVDQVIVKTANNLERAFDLAAQGPPLDESSILGYLDRLAQAWFDMLSCIRQNSSLLANRDAYGGVVTCVDGLLLKLLKVLDGIISSKPSTTVDVITLLERLMGIQNKLKSGYGFANHIHKVIDQIVAMTLEQAFLSPPTDKNDNRGKQKLMLPMEQAASNTQISVQDHPKVRTRGNQLFLARIAYIRVARRRS